ncbi:nucleoside-diphosphate kinase [Paenibacillus sediminis]|uniref:Nucleoside diphosphate kinase n=1 Tax=Paenibacillus sediminis TaxID=664909 RepID=A0ABS4GZQ8_9BACL|nr:nucleoside-diphosphate kinase [Paenibacillus sediminis]
MERTFLMVKPDGIQRGLIGKIISRMEDKGFKMIAGKLMFVSEELAKVHYQEHEGKPFFEKLVNFITSGPVFAMVWEGDDIIALSRNLIGKTNPSEAMPGTIRGDFASHATFNLIHGSDSKASADREIGIYFTPEQLLSYDKSISPWI